MRQEARSSALEPNTFVASQVADFTNDKALFHKFLEEVSDRKILLQQSAGESFNLVQIMVKAGLQLMGNGESFDDVEHEPLFSRSLSAICFLLSENSEILVFQSQFEALRENEQLWIWLFRTFSSLLIRKLPRSVTAAVDIAITTLLQGLQRDRLQAATFPQALQTVLQFTASLRTHQTVPIAPEQISDSDKQISLQVRLYSIVIRVLCCRDDLEFLTNTSKLLWGLFDDLASILQKYTFWKSTAYFAEVIEVGVSIAAYACRASFSQSWLQLAKQVLISLLTTFPSLPRNYSGLSIVLSLSLEKQVVFSRDIEKIYYRLFEIRQILPSVVIDELYHVFDVLTMEKSLQFSQHFTTTLISFSSGDRSEPQADPHVKVALANIFQKRQFINTPHPITAELYRLVCPTDAATDLNKVLELVQQRFESLPKDVQVSIIKLIGLLVCATKGIMRQASHRDANKFGFACDVCQKQPHKSMSTIAPSMNVPGRMALKILLNFAKCQTVRDSLEVRIELVRAIRCSCKHLSAFETESLANTSLLKYINSGLEDASRQIRIFAGQILVDHFRYGQRQFEEDIYIQNRRRVFDMLRRHMSVPRLLGSLIMTWADLGAVTRPDDLQLVLITLVDCLCNPNMFVRQTTIAAICRLANALGCSTYMLFSPYMRHISAQVLDRSEKHFEFIITFSRILGISSADFLSRNQQYLLPLMILHSLQNHIDSIAKSTKRSVKQAILDNIPYILSSLLTSGYNKDGGLMRFLAIAESSFQTVTLDELVNSYPIPLAVELLQLLVDPVVKRESVMAALSQVAHICSKTHASTRKTPRDMALDNLKEFLHKHSLGIVSQCEESMNGYRGKKGLLDRVRYISAVAELILLIQHGMESAVPQITAFLQTAMNESGLRSSALLAWDSLICVVTEEVAGPLIPYTICLFQSIWPLCNDQERGRIRSVLECILDDHQNTLAKQIGQVPRIRMEELQDIEEKIAKFRPSTALTTRLKQLTQLTISDNPIICEEGLRELLSLLHLRQTEVYGVILKDWKDQSLHDTLRNLLDISYKFRGTHEDVQILAAECLGVIGAIDPVRQDASKKITREVILHNFEDVDAEESVKFVRIFLENQLVNAFQSATRSNVQIFLAWAIQELLKFSGFDESVIALTDHRGVTQNVEAKKRWRMFSPAARDVMIPLLSSKYDAGRRSTKSEVAYPIINHAKNYNSWLYLFLSDLLQSAVGQNAQKLFGVFLRILREEETVISNFLLPYVFLNVCVGCSIDKRALLGLEIATILEPRPAADVFHAEYIRLARESVFLIIDYLSLWSRSRKIYNRDRLAEKMKRQNRHMLPEDENDKDQAVKIVQELTSQIPAKLMAEAALSCGAHSRALFYWEQHIRVQRVNKKSAKEELEPLYAQLQQLYININDPDGIEGVSSCLTDMTLEQEIMMHENAGRWTSAQSSYELALRNTTPNDDLRIGVLNCLKQTGHHDVLMDQAIRYLQVTEARDSRIIDLAIESSWTLGQWKETADLLHRAEHRSYDVLLGQSLLRYIEKDDDGYAQSIFELKRKILNDIGLSNLDSTWQCYDSLAKLAVVYELECRVHTSNQPAKILSPAILRDRLAIMPTTSPWKQHLLAVRRALLQADSSMTSARAISSTWLESAKLARKTGQSQQAYKAILNAMYCKDGTPLVKIEHARWWWKEGYQIRAIQTLQKALESKVFEGYEPDSHDSVLSLDASLINSGKSPKAALISKAELLLTRWTDIAEHTNSKQQLKEYVNAARGSQLEKPHYFMGRYYLRLLEAENKKSPEVQDQEFLQGEYHRQVVMSYGRAMHFGVKYIFQTLPSYLQLWLDFGQEARTVHQKAATTNQKRQDLSGLRISRLAHMNEKIKGFVHRLPTYLYMLAFPQILSRINHSDKGCYALLENMILKCLVDYPKQALWPFMAVCKSRDASRSTRGNTLIGRLRKEASKKENTNLSRLSLDAQNLTDQLMHLCTVPVIKNRASLSLTRDLDFNTNVAPSHLVVPIQNNLNVILPAHGGIGSTKHHRAFDENQPTILSFKDEVDVMASLQKPRKITIRGSDGELYPFLVKPNDDLRKDARLMDFNGVIQKFIRKDPEALKRLMKIRTYAVIALNEDHGLCEWVRNTRPLRDILVKTYAGRDISMQYAEVKTRLEQCLVAANPGQAFEVHVLKMFPPSFHDWFVEKFADPAQWFAARLSYSRTLAVMSMVGFVLGLGDRHGENILFDETTGDAVHVDFNCLFEKGHTFDKPERVPFRLTHNMVDALGVTGVEGAFRKTCEITLRILRTNQDAFNTVLESFLHDPVAEFLKKVKKSSNGEFEKAEAIKVLSVIANKLKGSAGTGAADKHTPLSIGGQADELIKQATDSKLLVQMYIGWTAWL